MKALYIIISLLFVHQFSVAQTTIPDEDSLSDETEEIEPYDFDTILNGGYVIVFKMDSALQYLYLMKDTIIAELSSCSAGLPYKNLGYVGADFNDEFVLVHSFGSGNPHYIELINKATGKNILKKGSAWIDAKEDLELLLYSEKDSPDKGDSMTLRNIKNGKEEKYLFPNELFDGPEVLNRIKIKSFDSKSFTIVYNTYEDWNNNLVKVYSR